jgi:hypothetical protein
VNLPHQFVIQLSPARPGAVLFLSIPTTRNALSIGPLLAGVDSEVVVRKDLIYQCHQEELRDYPMDYGEIPQGPDVQLRVEVESRDSLETRIQRVAPYYPEDARVLRRLIERQGLLSNAFSTSIVVNKDTLT